MLPNITLGDLGINCNEILVEGVKDTLHVNTEERLNNKLWENFCKRDKSSKDKSTFAGGKIPGIVTGGYSAEDEEEIDNLYCKSQDKKIKEEHKLFFLQFSASPTIAKFWYNCVVEKGRLATQVVEAKKLIAMRIIDANLECFKSSTEYEKQIDRLYYVIDNSPGLHVSTRPIGSSHEDFEFIASWIGFLDPTTARIVNINANGVKFLENNRLVIGKELTREPFKQPVKIDPTVSGTPYINILVSVKSPSYNGEFSATKEFNYSPKDLPIKFNWDFGDDPGRGVIILTACSKDYWRTDEKLCISPNVAQDPQSMSKGEHVRWFKPNESYRVCIVTDGIPARSERWSTCKDFIPRNVELLNGDRVVRLDLKDRSIRTPN